MTTSMIPAEPQPVRAVAPSDPMAMIQNAMASGVSIADLSRLFDLQERWEKQRAQEVFAEALTGFQRDCPRVHKARKTAGNFSFGYASLDDIDAVIRPILARYGVVIAFDSEHTTANNENVINVTVRVRVGSYYEDRKFGCPIPKDLRASDSQKWGAALSYAKRYALCAALNIVVTDEDDESKLGPETITATQLLEIRDLLKACPKDTESNMLGNWLKLDSLDLIPRARFDEVVSNLKRKAAQK